MEQYYACMLSFYFVIAPPPAKHLFYLSLTPSSLCVSRGVAYLCMMTGERDGAKLRRQQKTGF